MFQPKLKTSINSKFYKTMLLLFLDRRNRYIKQGLG